MAITYEWDITNLRKAPALDDLENVIVHVRWTCTGTDENGTTGMFSGATPLSSPDSENFTAYADLTKEQVLEWVQAVVVGEYWNHVSGQIAKQILKKNDPWSDVETAPWGQTLNSGPAANPAPEDEAP